MKTLSVAPLLALVACSGTPEAKPTSDKTLELYSWWTNPGEVDALDALLGLYRTKHPGTTVINAAVTGNENAHEQLRERMNGGSPPDTFQALGGWDLLQWVVYNGRDDTESTMEPLDFIAKENGWFKVLPQPVVDSISYNGKLYSIPIGLHRYNGLFFNKHVFADHGLNPPTTWAEFYKVAEALEADGIVPLALGNKLGWPIALVAWDGLLIAQAGREFRDSYLSGHESPNDPRIVTMLNEVVTILDHTNADRDLLSWDEAAQKVVEGTAAMTIMGDWAKGFFLSHGMEADVDIGQVPAPGTDGVFVYLVDSFGLPKGARNRQATLNFLNLIGSSEAQDTFNPIKGSTPPRTDANRSRYDVLAQKTLTDFQSDTLTLGREVMVASPEFNTQLVDTMGRSRSIATWTPS